MNEPLFFIDRHVPYDVFLNDIASRVVKMIKLDANDPELVSQRMAYKMFGRRNVQRWKRMGLIQYFKRPGKVEYYTAELRMLQRQSQDYFTEIDKKSLL